VELELQIKKILYPLNNISKKPTNYYYELFDYLLYKFVLILEL